MNKTPSVRFTMFNCASSGNHGKWRHLVHREPHLRLCDVTKVRSQYFPTRIILPEAGRCESILTFLGAYNLFWLGVLPPLTRLGAGNGRCVKIRQVHYEVFLNTSWLHIRRKKSVLWKVIFPHPSRRYSSNRYHVLGWLTVLDPGRSSVFTHRDQ